MKLVKDIDKNSLKKSEVSDKQAEEAFKTILKWIGEDPNREGLIETPKRVIKAFKEYKSDVVNNKFPSNKHSIKIEKKQLENFKKFLKKK